MGPDSATGSFRGPKVGSATMPMTSQVAMLLINTIPLLHLAIVVGVLLAPWADGAARLLAAVATLYLPPPLLARLIKRYFPVTGPLIYPGTRPFLSWLTLMNLQYVFCRLPFLEELLRFVPGLYSAWLRLWSAKIGCMTYWSPGTRVLERPFLSVGNHVVFGAGVHILAHALGKDSDGKTVLRFGCVTVGHDVIVGAYSVLSAGTELAPMQETRAFLRGKPFSYWEGGKAVRRSPNSG